MRRKKMVGWLLIAAAVGVFLYLRRVLLPGSGETGATPEQALKWRKEVGERAASTLVDTPSFLNQRVPIADSAGDNQDIVDVIDTNLVVSGSSLGASPALQLALKSAGINSLGGSGGSGLISSGQIVQPSGGMAGGGIGIMP